MSATMTVSAEAHSARYGPMESVLLFHNLVEAGAVSVESLQAAAAILMNNPLVDASHDRERFEPDALRKHVFHVIDDDGTAPVDPALLHQATVKLYERYRKAVVASIREDEEQYFQKQEEITEIKNGLCDERLLREHRERSMTSSMSASERGGASPEKREHSSAEGTPLPPPRADVTPPTALIAAPAEPTATDETPRSSPTTSVSATAPKERKSVESAKVTSLPLVGPRRPKTPQTPAAPATKPSPSVKAPPHLPVLPPPATVTLPTAVAPPTVVAPQTAKSRLSELAQVASVLPLLTEFSMEASRQQSNEPSAQKKTDPAKRQIHKPGPIAPAPPTLATIRTKTRKHSLPQLSKPPIRGTSKARQKQQELERQRQQEEEERRRQEGDEERRRPEGEEERRRPQAPPPPFPYSRAASTIPSPSPATQVRQRQEATILPQPSPTPARRQQRAQVGTPPRLGSRQPPPVPAQISAAPSGQPTATQSGAGPSRSVASGSTPIGPPGQPAVYPLAPPAPGTLARLMKTGALHSPQGVEKRTSPPQAGESPAHPPQMLPPHSPPAYNPHQMPAHPGGPASAARQPSFVPGPPLTPQNGALPQPMPLPHLSPMPGYGIMYGSPQNSPGGTSQLHVQQHPHGLSPPPHGSPQYPQYAYTAAPQQHQMGSHQQQPMSLPPMQQMQMHPPLATSPVLRNVHPQPVSAVLSPPAVFMSMDPGSPVQPGSEDISPISTPPSSPSPRAAVVAPAQRHPASALAGTTKLPVAIAAKPDANKTTAGTTSKGKGPPGRPRKRPLDISDAAAGGAQGQSARASAAKKDGTLMTPTPAKKPKLKDMLGSYPTPPLKTGRGGARGGRSTRGTGRGRPRGNRAAVAGRTTGLDVQDKDKTDQKQKDTVTEIPISTKSSEPSKLATVLKSGVPTPPVKKGPNIALANVGPATATTASTPKRGVTVTSPTLKEMPVEPATYKTNEEASENTEAPRAPEKPGVPEKPAECPVASPSTPAAQRSRKRKAVSPPQGADDTEDELDANSNPPPSVSRPPQPSVSTTPLTLAMTAGQQPMITAYRRFSGLATPLIGNIFSHKFANLFSAPVPESRAPGYKSLIYRPQDLKSIKAAVKAGAVALQSLSTTSAVATPTTTETPPLYPTTSTMVTTTTVTTPATTAVTPPRGIVSSQQLEKELFRMFANAVMYNKISTEIVKETVEMAKTVQAMVDDFRGAEEVGAKKRLLATKAVEEREREGSESVGGSVLGEGDDTGERMRKTPVSRRKVTKKKKGRLSAAAAMALAKKDGDQAQE